MMSLDVGVSGQRMGLVRSDLWDFGGHDEDGVWLMVFGEQVGRIDFSWQVDRLTGQHDAFQPPYIHMKIHLLSFETWFFVEQVWIAFPTRRV